MVSTVFAILWVIMLSTVSLLLHTLRKKNLQNLLNARARTILFDIHCRFNHVPIMLESGLPQALHILWLETMNVQYGDWWWIYENKFLNFCFICRVSYKCKTKIYILLKRCLKKQNINTYTKNSKCFSSLTDSYRQSPHQCTATVKGQKANAKQRYVALGTVSTRIQDNVGDTDIRVCSWVCIMEKSLHH